MAEKNMIIGDREEFLRLEVIERVPAEVQGSGDLRVSVTLTSMGFSGSYDQVWIEQPELLEFIKGLEVVVETRRGSVLLAAADPREFAVEIRATDSLGHFEAEAHVGRFVYGSSRDALSRVVGVIDIDPSSLPFLLREFKELLG